VVEPCIGRSFLLESDSGTKMMFVKARTSKLSKPTFVAVFFLLYSGIPFVIIGLDAGEYFGRFICNIIILLGFLYYIVKWVYGERRMSKFHIASLFLYAYCFSVSLVSNTFIFGYGLSEWLGQFVLMSILLTIFCFDAFGLTEDDTLLGLVIASVLISFLVFYDSLFQLSFLDIYTRGSNISAESRKVAVLKLEGTLTAALLFTIFFSVGKIGGITRAIYIILFLVVIFTTVFISESRVVLFSLFGSIVAFCALYINGMSRIIAIYIGSILSFIIIYFELSPQVNRLFSTDAYNYLNTDVGLLFRVYEYEYFEQLFSRTGGFGFGVMSLSPNNSNPLSWALHKGGYVYGTGSYGLAQSDTGIYASLHQFGYAGFLMVVMMSLYMALVFLRVRADRIVKWDYRILGILILILLLNPVPYNFFTLEWSGMAGNVLWFCAMALKRNSDEFIKSSKAG